MERISRLPPPPAVPPRSPEVAVAGEEIVMVPGPVPLEARVRVPEGAKRSILICHPHPLYGGSMHSPVPLAIAKLLAERDDVAHMRLNFRGVGASGGTYDDGRGEKDDARAAIAELRRRVPGTKLTVCGHSFGSWTGLRAAAEDGGVERVALIAPSVRFFEFDPKLAVPFDGRIAIFIGDRDEYCDVEEARGLAQTLGADLTVLEGFDHHFLKSRRTMAETVAPFIAPR